MKTRNNHLSCLKFPETNLYFSHSGKTGLCFLNRLRKEFPRVWPQQKGQKIFVLSKYSTVLITSSGKRLSAKAAQQGRDQKTQHRIWWREQVRSWRLHIPQEQEKFTFNSGSFSAPLVLPVTSVRKVQTLRQNYVPTWSCLPDLVPFCQTQSLSGILSSACHWPPASDYRLWA